MENLNKNINDLLADFCSGKINDRDLMVLHSWMEEKEANRKEANEYLKLYRNYRAYEAMDNIDSEKALNHIMNRVQQIKRRRRMIFIRSAAAVIVLLLGSVFVFNYLGEEAVDIQPQPIVQVIEPGEAKAMLILGDGTEINLEDMQDSTIQLAGGTNIEKENEVIDYRESKVETEVFNTIRIPRGGEYTLVLSDGTKVILNSDSELTYPVKFLGDKRKVTLKGEAYLEVAENANAPFILNTQGIAVEVLGTAFNVKSYDNERHIATTLVEGSVNLNSTPETVTLVPGEQGVIQTNGSGINVKKVDVSLYTAWKDGMFSFKSLPMEEIMKMFERWYNVEVKFEEEDFKHRRFTGNLKRYEDINPHLEVISLTTNIDFVIEKNVITVTQK